MEKIGFLLICICALISCDQNKEDQLGEFISERGYAYTPHVSAEGDRAEEGDEIYFHLEVVAKDSVLYDSRKDRQRVGRAQQFKLLPLSQMKDKANPLLDAFPMMTEGDSMSLFFPADSLPQLPPGLEDEKFVEYKIAVKSILHSEDMTGVERLDEVKHITESNIADFKNGKLSDLEELGDNYKVLIHEEGDGAVPRTGEFVQVHYYGALKEDGKVFDNSFERSSPFVFPINRNEVIKGWDMAMSSLKRGTKATLFVPSELAYGDQDNGPIKANSDLVFYIEILK